MAAGNWTELPPDVLRHIVKKLPYIFDFIHSRTICKPWRSSITASDLPPQFPWILKLGRGPFVEFYSVSSNEVYTIHAPSSSGKDLFGPAGGYMLARHSGKRDHFSLVNPLNDSEVCLPLLKGCKRDVFWIGPRSFQSDDYVVVRDHTSRLIVCKAGAGKWDCIGRASRNRYFYLKSMLFEVDNNTRVTKVIKDISSCKETYVIPPPKDESFPNKAPYLVESCGEILRVCFFHDAKIAYYGFDIHRLELGNEKGHFCWIKVTSIGDQMLFLDFATGRGFGLKANDFPGTKRNSIYFINKGNEYGWYHVINVYDIENSMIAYINCPFDRNKNITWFMPTLHHI